MVECFSTEMDSQKEARILIETIRRENTLDGTIGQRNAVSLIQNSLNV